MFRDGLMFMGGPRDPEPGRDSGSERDSRSVLGRFPFLRYPWAGLPDRLRKGWNRLRPFELDWIQVEVSARCAGGCRYCPVHRLADRRDVGLMESELFQRLLPAFSAANLVYLQGWGEPLLHPGFWEMARLVGEAGARVGFTTGGAQLDAANRSALLESSVDILGVSLAGATPEIHDGFRPGNPLEVLDGNLMALRGEAASRGMNPPELHLAWILMADNLEELPAAVDRAHRWGAAQLVVSQLSLVLGPEMEQQSILVRSDLWPRARQVISEARSRAQEAGLLLHLHGFRDSSSQVKEEAGPLSKGDRPAGESRQDRAGQSQGEGPPGTLQACPENILRSCFVSWAGDVSPCVMTNLGLKTGVGATHEFMGREIPIRTLIMGNLAEASLEEIWKGREFRDFRRVFRRRIWQGAREREGLPEPCRTCWKLTMV